MVDRLISLPAAAVAAARGALVLALLLAALRLFLPPWPSGVFGAPLPWLGLACALGFVLARRRALLLASLYPALCPLGLWYYRTTRPEAAIDDEGWIGLLALAGLALGLVGVALGLGLRRLLRAVLVRAWPLSPRAAERLLLAGALVAALGAAALDRGLGGGVVSRPWPPVPHELTDAEVRAATARYPFAVYGAAASEGTPDDIQRYQGGRWRGPEVTLLYCPRGCGGDGYVFISSGPPGHTAGLASGGGFAVAGVTWREHPSVASLPYYEAYADLGDASVSVLAASREDFARVAAGLRRVNR